MWQCEPQPRARRVDECGSASRSRRRGESMNDERGEIAVKLRVGVFVLVALAAFLGMVYALGARARLFEAHYTIHAEFTEVAGLTEGADTARDAAALVAALRKTAEDVNRSKLVDDVSATVGKINRVVDQVEHGRGWAHALLYEEPVALKRLNETVTTTQKLLDRVAEGQGPAGVLLSPTGTDAARRFVGAMDRLGSPVDRPGGDQGLPPALLFEPKYKETLEDLRTITRNLRDVSDRIAGGRGALGSLIADGDAGGLRQIVQDLRVTVANLKEISEKVKEGEGTIGALLADPTIYERLVTILEGAQRSFLLRSLIRGLGEKGAESKGDGPRR